MKQGGWKKFHLKVFRHFRDLGIWILMRKCSCLSFTKVRQVHWCQTVNAKKFNKLFISKIINDIINPNDNVFLDIQSNSIDTLNALI